ncbi:hypothetical protein [Burkholderia sp. Bp9090]|uniref:hypothetical protein n=1 Tax=Burkholderia sp. Bp9090 TaxID=2184567 RepID=UPI000F5DADEB|nr:hypothetical protein [Burkholderia sp. Bp9090]
MDSNRVPMAAILPPASRGERRGCFRLYAERARNIVTVRVTVWPSRNLSVCLVSRDGLNKSCSVVHCDRCEAEECRQNFSVSLAVSVGWELAEPLSYKGFDVLIDNRVGLICRV